MLISIDIQLKIIFFVELIGNVYILIEYIMYNIILIIFHPDKSL